MASLYIGTSAFTAAGWEGSFYPAGMKVQFVSRTRYRDLSPTPLSRTKATLFDARSISNIYL
jgi:hypothetical protein